MLLIYKRKQDIIFGLPKTNVSSCLALGNNSEMIFAQPRLTISTTFDRTAISIFNE